MGYWSIVVLKDIILSWAGSHGKIVAVARAPHTEVESFQRMQCHLEVVAHIYIFRPLTGIAEVIPMVRGRPHKCPYCSSQNTICKGARVTKTQGIRRIRCCKNCKRKFTPKNQKTAGYNVIK